MKLERPTSGLVRESDGSFTASYGPYVLRTAFQPIYSQTDRGEATVEAVEALIRPFKGSEAVSPAQFFSIVVETDLPAVERLSRKLHVVNMGQGPFRRHMLFLNFNPQAFSGFAEMEQEADDLARLARYLDLAPQQIVCEIIEKQAGSRTLLSALVEALRGRGFKIAIDDYGAEESDIERVNLVKPEIVKFDGHWAKRFLETTEGFALLRTMVRGFSDMGIVTLFEGLEEHWQVATCRELGPCLLQGFVLGRPELAIAATPPGATPARRRPPAPAAVTAEHEAGRASGMPAAAPPVAVQPQRRAIFGRRGR